jgi:hypothetical protein
MSQNEIKEIKGVWTEDEVTKIKSWASSEKRTVTIKESLESSQEQSKIIEELALVDPQNLKKPFNFIID